MSQNKTAPKLSWDKARPAPVVLISGPEGYLADQAFELIKKNLSQSDPSLLTHSVAADSYSAGEIYTLASPSLFGEPRLIKIDRVERSNDSLISDGKSYVLSPDPDTTVVFRHSSGVRGKALLDAIRKESPGAIEIHCPEVKAKDRGALVRDEVRRSGARIDNSSLMLLLEAYQDDLEELMSVTRQLIAVSNGEINDHRVEHITGGRVEAGAFRVADAAVSGNANEALVLMRQALSTGTAQIPLLAALNLKVRTMAKVMGARESVNDLAKSFGIAPWQAERALRDVRGWRETNLAKAIDMGADTELLLKGGSRSPEYALEKFVLFVARRGNVLK
ncbi:MAG TPA: DNA polymerase III subunit delta [Microbacteriaceae bacterium]|nr:DNA polymerase III subunit delta [Microbacteriaceae bacterium]